MIIMPSTPRLRTPERSTTSSPEAASRSGVDAVITVMMKLTEKISFKISARTSGMGGQGGSWGAYQAEAVDDQGVAGEHVEQQNALEYLGEVEGNLHRYLRLFAANERQR